MNPKDLFEESIDNKERVLNNIINFRNEIREKMIEYVREYFNDYSISEDLALDIYPLLEYKAIKYKEIKEQEEIDMANKALYIIEIIKLMNGLIKKSISFKFQTIYDGYQIIVYDENNERDWDAVCHNFSYGHKSGLLEIYGSIVNKNVGDSVEGFLTADDILRRL